MRRRKRFADEEREEDSEEGPEEAGEGSRGRHSKALCSFADDAVPESPWLLDRRYFRGHRGCLGY